MKKSVSIVLLLVLCCGLSLFGWIVFGDFESEPTTAVSTTVPEPAPPYTEIRQNLEDMTEAQWEAYADSLAGKSIEGWTGTVKDVDQTLGSYAVLVAVGDDDNQVSVPVDEDTALLFNKGDEVTFSGTVSSVTWVLGLVDLTLRDATIE